MIKHNLLINSTEYLLLSLLYLNQPTALSFDQIKSFSLRLSDSTIYLYLIILQKQKLIKQNRVTNKTYYSLTDKGKAVYLDCSKKQTNSEDSGEEKRFSFFAQK